jgi:hypothetical protein
MRLTLDTEMPALKWMINIASGNVAFLYSLQVLLVSALERKTD